MSTLAASDVRVLESPRSRWMVGLATLLAILGLATIWSTDVYLWALWTTDPLKSIGMLIPAVSMVLIIRAWRTLDWEMNGTWWGLILLVATIGVVRLREQAIILFVISPQWFVYVPPHSLVAFSYGSAVVLLFGGTRLYRAGLFPIVLLLFVNPTPHIFSVFVDLPLQRVSAHLARGFAIALGQRLSPDQLRLMFTPDFGMFIAPGCNGIRGAVTMGYIALVAGYLYRFRWHAHALVVAGAVLLGYVFNFLRLFVLVLYYLVALKFPWLQDRAETADYLLGAALFLVGTFLLFVVIRRVGRTAQRPLRLAVSGVAGVPSQMYPRLAGMTILVLLGLASLAHALRRPAAQIFTQNPESQFPARIGNYALVRSWTETLDTGALIFNWADYGRSDGGQHVLVGVSPVLGSHDTVICHSARGEEPSWHRQLTLATAGGVPINFSASFYSDGAMQFIEATTLCNGSSCGEYAAGGMRFGLVYSRPTPEALLSRDPERPIPVLIKVETTDTNLPADYAREQMTRSLSDFVSMASVEGLTLPYRGR